MTQSNLMTVQSINKDLLTEIVRQDQNCSDFIITDWVVETAGGKGLSHPDRMFCISGHGFRPGEEKSSAKPWSVLLKIVTRPDDNPDLPITDTWYWKRELLVVQSGQQAEWVAPFKAACIYAINEHEDGAWIWMEYVKEQSAPRWTMAQYIFAARLLGRMGGAYLAGKPLPDHPWFCRDHYRSYYRNWKSLNNWEMTQDPVTFSASDCERYERLCADRELFWKVLDHMPQTFVHFDTQRRNMLIRQNKDGEDEIVLVDWELCGIGPIGADLSHLVANSALLFELDPADIKNLSDLAFQAYLDGLQEAGYRPNADQIKLSYYSALSMYPGTALPVFRGFVATEDGFRYLQSQFGCQLDDMIAGWKMLFDFVMDRADEARMLMDQMG